jgi:hypothetical protein
LDLRNLARLDRTYDGISESGCLYHLTKPEFARCAATAMRCWRQTGCLPDNERGRCEHFEDEPGARYPGGAEPQMRLHGKPFHAYCGRDELITLPQGFELLHEQRVEPSTGRFELWLRRS